MNGLHEKYIQKIDATPMDFTRSLMDTIHWEARLGYANDMMVWMAVF